MRRFFGIIFSGILILALAGCGKTEKYTNSFLKVAQDGTITGIMVEEFSKSFYTLAGLEEMMRLEIAQYNADAGEERITLESVTIEEANVIGVMKYKSAEDYSKYNGFEIFAGTIKEAQETGIDLNVSLVDIQTKEVIGKEQLLQYESYQLVMWNEQIEVQTPGKILYYSDNLNLIQPKQIIVKEEGTPPYYLVFK